MAQITKSIAAGHRLVANLVPVDVLKQIDQAELMDRIVHAEELGRKSRTAADPTLRKGYASLARAVLRAQPRAVTQQRSADLIAKAAGLGNSGQAAALRRQAQELLELHPPAPRREDTVTATDAVIAKAKAEDSHVVAVYDQAGNMVGICDPDEIQPIATATATDVAKAVRSRRQVPTRKVR